MVAKGKDTKEDIEKHLINDEVTLQKELFPKLRRDLSKEHANIVNRREWLWNPALTVHKTQ